MDVKKEYSRLIAEKVVKSLESRNMSGCYAADKAEALQKVLSLIPQGSSISWGGSETMSELSVKEALYADGSFDIIDRAKAKTPDEAAEIMHKAFFADYYIMSTNALTLDGELFNIDGNGNRTAALIYGPKNVIILAGINKIVKNLDDAMNRVRNYTAPMNGIRLGCATPCAETGYCHDCKAAASMCCQMVTTRYSRVKDRIKVIIIGEELGY